jgi:hypothetical protein
MTQSQTTNPSAISLADLNTTINHEPRILDTRIAERLGFSRPRKVREIIERNRAELEMHGPIVSEDATTHGGTRPTAGRVYWLNEGQTMVVCMLSRTPNAAAIRKEVIEVYMAWRRGTLAPPTKTVTVRAHLRRIRDANFDPRQYLLPPPVIRDGIGMVVIGNEAVWFDGAALDFASAKCVVLRGADFTVGEVERETDYDDAPHHWKRRDALMPWQSTPTALYRERSQVRVLGRVIATRRIGK